MAKYGKRPVSNFKSDNSLDTVIDDMDLSNLKPIIRKAMETVSDGAMVMSSANGLVGTGFASRFRLQHQSVFFKGLL